MTTNKINQTKEGFSVLTKEENGEIYNYVPRDERLTYLANSEIPVTAEEILITNEIVVVKVTLAVKSDFHQAVGSCRLTNTNTEDHAGLAYKKAVDNALQTLGVGLILKDGTPVSSLNRGLTQEEKVKSAMNSQLP